MIRRPPRSTRTDTLFPYTTLFRSEWTVTNPKGERLVITIEEVFSDTAHDLGVDPGLRKDGVEAHLQELLAAACHHIEDGMVLVRREHSTEIGPVDLLYRDSESSEERRGGKECVRTCRNRW